MTDKNLPARRATKKEKQRRVPEKQRQPAKAIGIPRRPQPHGGALLASGVPGNRGGRGGGRPITHGLYADLTKHPEVRDLLREFEANDQPLSTLQEVAMIRALAVHLFNRVKPHKKLAPREIIAGVKILSEVTKAVKRIEDTRIQNAISRDNFIRLMRQMAVEVRAVLEARVSDTEMRMQIIRDINERWQRIPAG